MKAIHLLPLCLCLLMTACAGDVPERTAGIPTRVSGTEKALVLSVELGNRTGAARAKDGTLLASYDYRTPELRVTRGGEAVTERTARTDREKQAVQIAESFNERFQEWEEDADFPALEAAARQDYQWRYQEGEPWDIEYYQGLDCGVYQTDSLVSVRGLFYSYYGGVHPNTVCLGWNYDLISGRFVSAEQLFDDVESVTAELVRQARERASGAGLAPEEYFWSDYAEILSAWSDSTVAVTFNQEDMTVSYSPYDLAAYAVGEQIFTISRTWLEPYLNEYGRTLLA